VDSSATPRWIAATVLVSVVTGCGDSDAPPQRRAAAIVTTTPAERLDLSVVAITALIGREQEESTGVVVDVDRGLILTTAHGVWGARSLRVATGIAVLHGRIVARDACDDLAVLETQPRLPGLVAVRPSPDGTLDAGVPVLAVRRRAALPSGGRPDLVTQRVTTRAAARRADLVPDGARALDAPQLSAAASGAPLIGRDGRLAGLAQIVERGAGTTRAALPWDMIEARMRELRPGGRAAYVGWRRHYRCSGALHRYVSARHRAYRRSDAQLNAPVPATRLPGTEAVDR
jgi:S1-C subfamily serine protease